MTDNIKLPIPPKPDTHCFDEDRATDVWSHSQAQMLAYARAAVEADRTQRVLDADGDSLTIAYLHGFAKGKDAALTAAPQPAQQPLTDAQIKRIMLDNGFTIKEGLTDLKPYVYAAARAIEQAHGIGVKND